MARVLLVAAVLLLAIVATAAAPSYDIDEQALLAELEDRPVESASADSLLSLSDLSPEALSLLSTEENAVAKELLERKKAPATIDFLKLNAAPKKGVDVWTLKSERGVYNKPFGTVIGNVPAGSTVVIQNYKYGTEKGVEAQFGYGYLSSNGGFGGWAGENACGWFVLQRKSGDDVRQDGGLEKNIPNHPAKCPEIKKAKALLARSKIFKQGSYLKDGSLIKAVTKSECPAFLNYDPATGSPTGAAPALPSGAYSGKGALGVVPAGFAQKQKVKGFGVKYVTKDGKYALVKYPGLDRANPGHNNFFVDCNCLEFDTSAVKAAQGATFVETKTEVHTEAKVEAKAEAEAEAEQETEAESEQESEESLAAEEAEAFPEAEFAAMEVQSEAHMAVAAEDEEAFAPHRGNYPGWTNMLEVRSTQAPAPAAAAPAPAAPAAAPAAPSVAAPVPVQKNLPPEGPNVKHIRLSEGEGFAKLRNANVGIKKVHVHVNGAADPAVDSQRRVKSMVRRLADNQTQSYKRINKLLAKLKKCSSSSNTKECLSKLTEKVKDWRAEYAAKA